MVRGENEKEASSSTVQQQQQPIMKETEYVQVLDNDDTNYNDNNGDKQRTAAATTAVSLNNSTSADVETQDNNNTTTACWDNLPSVILVEIFSYLPHQDRINASQVCRHWRYALFHPSFWKKITFPLIDKDSILWSRCFSSWFKFSVQEVTICCESANNFVKEALLILKKMSTNRQLRKLYLEPSRCMFEYPTHEVNSKKLLKQILNIVETSSHLESLSLGCIEELTENLTLILEPLKANHANHLLHLSLASVKDDPDGYEFCDLDCSLFSYFHSLRILTIDYDYVNDDFLEALNSGTMERLVIHVHGWNGDYVGASNSAWASFVKKNRKCEIRINLIHSYNAVRVLHGEILQPAMPLTHLKVLFCEGVNYLALHQISDWYSNTLQSIVWIDSFNTQKTVFNLPNDFDHINNPDPLVLAAWRCQNLKEIVFIGSKYFADNLLAILRLRSKTLQRLEFTESDIVYDLLDSETILEEVQEVMGKQWKLLSDQELPKVVINPLSGDSREVIMPMVLRDQK